MPKGECSKIWRYLSFSVGGGHPGVFAHPIRCGLQGFCLIRLKTFVRLVGSAALGQLSFQSYNPIFKPLDFQCLVRNLIVHGIPACMPGRWGRMNLWSDSDVLLDEVGTEAGALLPWILINFKNVLKMESTVPQ